MWRDLFQEGRKFCYRMMKRLLQEGLDLLEEIESLKTSRVLMGNLRG